MCLPSPWIIGDFDVCNTSKATLQNAHRANEPTFVHLLILTSIIFYHLVRTDFLQIKLNMYWRKHIYRNIFLWCVWHLSNDIFNIINLKLFYNGAFIEFISNQCIWNSTATAWGSKPFKFKTPQNYDTSRAAQINYDILCNTWIWFGWWNVFIDGYSSILFTILNSNLSRKNNEKIQKKMSKSVFNRTLIHDT